jgi:ribulose-5-phosphate 4-epimerase/fuculose-1-phosphate aldolase
VIDDGVIKYDRTNFSHSGPIDSSIWTNLEAWRAKLFKLNLIGEYPIEKVGFGNLSLLIERKEQSHFVITGTQTGRLENLSGEHYTLINGYDLLSMKLFSKGPIEPSSEALTHASIYESNPKIKAVFHIHSEKIWKSMIKYSYDFTKEDIPYGTQEMANNVKEVISSKSFGTIVMKGHQDGVIAYGESLDQCGELILNLSEKFL